MHFKSCECLVKWFCDIIQNSLKEWSKTTRGLIAYRSWTDHWGHRNRFKSWKYSDNGEWKKAPENDVLVKCIPGKYNIENIIT